MKLYDGGKAPNPRRVRVFLAEKGIEIPLVTVDMGQGGHRAPAIADRNPMLRLPILELDDGTILTESIAICRYFEELHPEPSLFGKTALEVARIEEWQRRLELDFLLRVGHAFRHTHPAMKEWEAPQVAEWGDANRPKVLEFLSLVDRELAGREYMAGDRYSIADITGMIAVDFMKPARIQMPEQFVHVRRWYDNVSARPSAKA